MAAYVELYLDQGATFENVINLTNDATNTPMNVYNYNVSSQMRRSYYSANISANISCVVTDATNGEITLTLSAANTANLKPGRYVFDVLTKDPSNITSRVLEGIITVTPRVTR